MLGHCWKRLHAWELIPKSAVQIWRNWYHKCFINIRHIYLFLLVVFISPSLTFKRKHVRIGISLRCLTDTTMLVCHIEAGPRGMACYCYSWGQPTTRNKNVTFHIYSKWNVLQYIWTARLVWMTIIRLSASFERGAIFLFLWTRFLAGNIRSGSWTRPLAPKAGKL